MVFFHNKVVFYLSHNKLFSIIKLSSFKLGFRIHTMHWYFHHNIVQLVCTIKLLFLIIVIFILLINYHTDISVVFLFHNKQIYSHNRLQNKVTFAYNKTFIFQNSLFYSRNKISH